MQEETYLRGSRPLITLAAMLSVLMAYLDVSVVNVALSDIRASFGTPLDQIAWVSTSYMMSNVIVIPLTGFLKQRFGYRRYFVTSLLVFTLASGLCGLAWNLQSLILFRVVQGIGGGAIIPTSQAILLARYPKSEHGMAGALFGLAAVSGPLLGPTVGGNLIESFDWHWIFLINVPFGLLAALLSYRHIHEPGFVAQRDAVDWRGIALLTVGLVSLQYVLDEGQGRGWSESHLVVGLSWLALIALGGFVAHELEVENPVVNLRIFANRSYSAASGLNFLVGVALFSGSFLFALYCGAVMRYSALEIGKVFLAGSAVQILLMPLIGRLGSRFDQRLLIAFGVLVLCYSLWLNGHLNERASFLGLAYPLFVRSCGIGFVFVPLGILALSDLPEQQRGAGAGLFNLTRELGGSIGTAGIMTLLDRRAHTHGQHLAEHLSITNPSALTELAGMRRSLQALLARYDLAAFEVFRFRVTGQALVRAFNDAFLVLVSIFAGSLLLILVLRPGAARGGAVTH